MLFSTKMRSSKSYKIEYKPTINKITVLIVHKYEIRFLNCCKLGNCVTLLAIPFHSCIPLTVIDSSLWVVSSIVGSYEGMLAGSGGIPPVEGGSHHVKI